MTATISPDGKLMRIYSVNSTSGSIRVRFHLQDFAAASKATVYVLRDRENRGDSEAMNTTDDPERVAVVAGAFPAAGNEPQFVFEPYSVTLLELNAR